MNTSVQHVVDAVEVEKHIINEKINQVTRHVEVPEIPLVARLQFTDKVVDIPVVAQRQIHANRNVQKTIEIPQLQDADKVVDVPVLSVVRAGHGADSSDPTVAVA